jgi:hypothetical protein
MKDKKEFSKKLVINKETIKNLTVKESAKPAPDGRADCPSWPDASCCPPTSNAC